MSKEFDYKRVGNSKKNRKWVERYLPVSFSIFVSILLGMFSLNISHEVNNLTNNLDKFYKHPYKVRNAVSDFKLNALEIVNLWSGHSANTLSISELELTVKRKIVVLDSAFVIIKDKYLGEGEETLALLESYNSFKNYINTTDFSVDKLNHAESEFVEINLLLQDIVNKLGPIDNFASAKAKEYMSEYLIEDGFLLQKLKQLYIITIVFFGIGLYSILYLLMGKNLILYREQERFLQSIELSLVPMVIHKNGVIMQVSKEWVKQTGYSKEDIPTIEEWCRKAYGDDYMSRLEFIYKTYELETLQEDGIWTVKTKSGDEIIWRFRSGPLGDGIVFSTAINLTEEHKKQQQIENFYVEKLKLATAVDQSPASILITDTNGNIEYVNNYFTEITGYSSDEVVGLKPSILKSGFQDANYYKDLWETISSGKVWRGDLQNRAKDGTIFWELASISPITDAQGNVINYVAVKENITEKKHTQDALIKSEKKYRDVFTRSTDACLIIKDGVYIDCNKAALMALGMRSKKALIGLKPSDISPEFQEDGSRSDSGAVNKMLKATKEKHIRFEWLHKKIIGEVFPSEVMLTKIEEDDEDYFYVVWRDITERKKQEKLLKENLEEKEVLLSEIHHRVKNNLAIISGLLELQIFSAKNSKVISALGLSVQRIKTMAIIHEQMYESGDFTAISIDESLQVQIENLRKIYGVNRGKVIAVTYDLEVIKISINQAIPFGLLINELASNSFKYAFDGVEHPTLSILLHAKKDVIEFNIQDNGIGFNVDKFNNEEDSLTQNLINVFVSQLNGNLDIQSSPDKGTSVTLTFKPTLKRGSSSNL